MGPVAIRSRRKALSRRLVGLGSRLRRQALSRSDSNGPVNAAYRAFAFTGSAPEFDRESTMHWIADMTYPILTQAGTRGCGARDFRSANMRQLSSSTFCWSVGDWDLGFPFLAGSLCDVEGTLFAIVWLSR
ncbi:hypothetical protein Taro_025229 [Colocasia esculenta]|uniref:Uncharacterized protein n=1 Tax=Colocasia esculenta TaxID=4460 RepID=A0A843VJW9_COLES|nr:hypothetical protein [Colocasia esculenta]